MPRLSPCPSCQSHVFANEATCPHCGAALTARSSGVAKAAVLVGLALTGCPTNVEPVYGVPESDTGTSESGTETNDSDSAGEAEYGSPDTGDLTTTSDTGEPEYGVPDTGTETSTSDTGEPEYGVPDTGTDTTDTGTTAEPLYGVADSSN